MILASISPFHLTHKTLNTTAKPDMKMKLTASQESFDALINLLEQKGNQVVGKRWRCNKEGLFSELKYPIDWATINESFSIDANSVLVSDHAIWTISEWLTIVHR